MAKKKVTLEQVREAYIKDLAKGFAKIEKAINKAKSMDEIGEIVSVYVDDCISDKAIGLLVKFTDQEEGL